VGKLDGKVAVITGGTSGMALAGAKLFVDEGAHVFISGRRKEALDEAVKLIGRNVTGVQGDSANLDDLDRLFETVKQEKGTIDVFFSKDAISDLSTMIALHHGMGLKAEPLRPEDARELEPSISPELEAAALRPEEASIDNRAFTHAMLSAAKKSGVEIFASAGVTGIVQEGRRCTGLKLGNETVSAKWTVIAAGCFSARIEGVAGYAPVTPAKGQMMALRCEAVNLKKDLWSGHMYLVPRNDGRIIAGATVEYEGFDRNVTVAGMKKILTGAISLVPALESARIEETWAGLRPDSPDHLPILGPTNMEGLLIATGHFRSGILLTPVTARLVGEWITTQKVSEDWAPFSPMRFQTARHSRGA